MEVIRMTFFWLNVSIVSLSCIAVCETNSFLVDGFFLDKNGSDCIYLDDIVFRDIASPDKQEELQLNQYYG